MTAPRPRRLFSVAVYAWFIAAIAVYAVVGVLLLPWTLVFDRDRRVAARLGSWIVRTTLRVPRGWRTASRGIASVDLGRPAVVVMNHRSIADIAIAVALPGAPRLCAKPWVGRVPLLRQAMWIAGHTVFDPADLADVRRMLDHTEGLVRRGVPVLFFPEGARRTGPELGRFEGGAFEVATRCGADVLPVVVRRTGDLVPRGSLVFHDVEVTVTPLERVPAGTDRAALAVRVRDAMRAVFEAV